MAESPVVARWELSRRLATRRKERGFDVKTITDALGFTRNYWSAVENDRTLIAEDKLRQLFQVLDYDESERAELLELREDARKKGWWDEFPSLSDEQKRFYGMEYGASGIRAYDGHLVPGLLQIEAYARAVIKANPGISPVEVDRMIAVRQRRQQELLTDRDVGVRFLISEAVLRQQVSGPTVQAEQLRRLLELVRSDALDLQVYVLPFDVNPGTIVNSTTLLFFEFDSSHLLSAAWQEGVQLFGTVKADDEVYAHLNLGWQDGISRSLGPGPSLELIEHAADEFERMAS